MNGRVALVTLLLLACSHGPRRPEASPVSVPLPSHLTGEQGLAYVPVAAQTGEMERCIDRELAARRLNDFGDPEGTTYPPGAPVVSLTDRTARYAHVMKRQPDIATSCTRAPGEPWR